MCPLFNFHRSFIMKAWTTPEVKVFSVKMDENIAASGDERMQVYFNPGGNIWVYVNGQIIIDTSYGWYMNGGTATASFAYQQNTGSTGSWILDGSSCRA